MLISVHLPKTAGSSFLVALEQHFGDRLLKDYGDRPITRSAPGRTAAAIRNCAAYACSGAALADYDCIHGHFMPLKYRLLRAGSRAQFVTWMRDPVERLASHYFHWMRVAPPAHASAIRRRVYKEQWSLARFCLGSEFRNLYSKYLWGFPLNRFDFIGITEYYPTEIEYFANRFMPLQLSVAQENINPWRETSTYSEVAGIRAEIEGHHAADMTLYQRALERRESRA